MILPQVWLGLLSAKLLPLTADKQVFVRLIEAGIRPKRGDDKSFPMDAALMAALESYEVSFLLLHGAVTKPPKRPPPRLTRGGQKDDDPKKPRKGNGKGGQKTGSGRPRVPKAIMDLGGQAMTPDGSECCYGYNLGKCNVKGCKRKHVCCKCFGSHPGGVHGTRCNFDNFPATSAILAILLRCACPEATFTSIAGIFAKRHSCLFCFHSRCSAAQ